MKELALHLMDIAENSVAARARTITLEVIEDLRADRLTLSVQDDGKGMSPDMVACVVDPFVTTRTTRKVGLGIPLFKEAAEQCHGGLWIDSQVGVGTRITAEFQHSHIDRMPLGHLADTVLTLLIGHPQIHWILRYRHNDYTFDFDDAPLKQELGDLPLTEPDALKFIREMLEEGIANAVSNQ
jgi:hypothetical protein